MDWATTARDFHQYLITSARAENTAKSYTSNLHGFWTWCTRRECLPHDADRAFVREWISERLATVSSQRAHNDLASLRWFFRMLIQDHYRDDDPSATLTVKRRKSLPTEPLEKCDIEALLRACTHERDRLIVLLLATTGLRIAELAALTADNVNWRTGVIAVVGKGDKEREVKPNADTFGRLYAFMGMFPSGPLFVSQREQRALSAQQIRKVLYEVGERAHVKVHPHRFRAWFAVENIEQGVPLDTIQEMLGHSSLTTTAIYTQQTKKRRALEAMARFRLGETA